MRKSIIDCKEYKNKTDQLVLPDKGLINSECSQTNIIPSLKDKNISFVPNIEIVPSSGRQFSNNTILMNEDNFTEGMY